MRELFTRTTLNLHNIYDQEVYKFSRTTALTSTTKMHFQKTLALLLTTLLSLVTAQYYTNCDAKQVAACCQPPALLTLELECSFLYPGSQCAPANTYCCNQPLLPSSNGVDVSVHQGSLEVSSVQLLTSFIAYLASGMHEISAIGRN